MTIQINLTTTTIPCIAKYKDSFGNVKEMDSFRVKRFSGKSVYIVALKDNIKMSTVRKVMKFEEGKVFIKMGESLINIGTYKEVIQ